MKFNLSKFCVLANDAFWACLLSVLLFGDVLARTPDSYSYEFEGSNEAYIQGGLNREEFAKWVLLDLELDLDGDFAASEAKDTSFIFGLKLGAEYDANERGYELEERFIGYRFGANSFGYGYKEYATEEFGVDGDVNFGRNTTFEQVESRGRNVFFMQSELDNTLVIASTDRSSDLTSYDLFIEHDLSDNWQFTAAFQRFDRKLFADQHADSISTFGVSIQYSFGDYGLYYSLANNRSQTGYDLSLKRKFGAGHEMVFSCGYERIKDGENQTQCFANYTYAITDRFFINSEVGYLDTEDANGIGYLLGVEVEF